MTPPGAPEPAAPRTEAVTTADAAPMVRKAQPKPVHPLTIAADESTFARLKTLAAVMPGQPIKIVKVQDDAGRKSAADFTVRTTLQSADDAQRFRNAKLFTEQLHIIAGPHVAHVEDLRDRIVSFGRDGSAGQDAARKAFQAVGVAVKETPLDLDNALDGLATGDIDAVVVLAPQPFERLRAVSQSGLHLLSWPEGASLPTGTAASTIESADYPGLAKPGDIIRAVAVDAVLSVSAKGATQPAAKRFLSVLAQHSAALSKRGFDLLKADLDSQIDRRVASIDKR